jgi:hypothetical protein
MDQQLGRLLRYLDAKVGKGRYVLVLTSDHGVCPLPEVARRQGKEAGRILPALFTGKAEGFLRSKYSKKEEKTHWIEAAEYPWVYLNQRLLRERGLKSADVEKELAGWLAKQPGVLAAYTRSQLSGEMPKDVPFGEQVRKSFQASRCGDVAVVTKSNYLITPYLTGTSHGAPHAYDTHVPLLVYGPGVQAGERKEAVTPQAVAAILARSLSIQPPKNAEAPVPVDLFKSR